MTSETKGGIASHQPLAQFSLGCPPPYCPQKKQEEKREKKTKAKAKRNQASFLLICLFSFEFPRREMTEVKMELTSNEEKLTIRDISMAAEAQTKQGDTFYLITQR